MPHIEDNEKGPGTFFQSPGRLSRRALMCAGSTGFLAAVAAGGPLSGILRASEDSKPMNQSSNQPNTEKLPNGGAEDQGYIDAHVHVWTPDTKHYPLTAGYRREQMQPPSFEPSELLRHATPCGVDRIVLIQMSFYGFDNRYMLDSMAKHPGVFSGVAVIDDGAKDPAAEMRRLKGLGVRGFRIYPRNMPVDRWLDGQGMKAMWKCGAAEKLAMCHLVNPVELPAIDQMCARNPDTPVVIDHFARIGIDGKIHEKDVRNLVRLARHEQTHVKLSAFYALGKKKPPYKDMLPLIRRLIDAFGPQRLMWATDCPFQVAGDQTYEQSLAVIRDHLDGISDEDRDWILRRTAAKVFFG